MLYYVPRWIEVTHIDMQGSRTWITQHRPKGGSFRKPGSMHLSHGELELSGCLKGSFIDKLANNSGFPKRDHPPLRSPDSKEGMSRTVIAPRRNSSTPCLSTGFHAAEFEDSNVQESCLPHAKSQPLPQANADKCTASKNTRWKQNWIVCVLGRGKEHFILENTVVEAAGVLRPQFTHIRKLRRFKKLMRAQGICILLTGSRGYKTPGGQ